MGDDQTSDQAIGERLRLTREVLRLTQIEFSRRANINAGAYNQYEQGKKRPSVATAIALCETYHLDLDWIFRGHLGALPYDMAEAIKALRKSGRPH